MLGSTSQQEAMPTDSRTAISSYRCFLRYGTKHLLRITVRAWDDPYIKAAELTHGTFDFGFSPATELTAGSA